LYLVSVNLSGEDFKKNKYTLKIIHQKNSGRERHARAFARLLRIHASLSCIVLSKEDSNQVFGTLTEFLESPIKQ
jgi:hypothetical protein